MKNLNVKKSILILGIGNILCKDDGAGVHVVNEIMASDKSLPENVEILDGGIMGLDLLPLLTGREKIVIVDALKTDDIPGSIYRFPAKHLKGNGSMLSLHEVGVKKIIDMLKLMGHEPKVEIIGIVPEDIRSLEIGISESVRKSIPKAVECVLEAAAQ